MLSERHASSCKLNALSTCLITWTEPLGAMFDLVKKIKRRHGIKVVRVFAVSEAPDHPGRMCTMSKSQPIRRCVYDIPCSIKTVDNIVPDQNAPSR